MLGYCQVGRNAFMSIYIIGLVVFMRHFALKIRRRPSHFHMSMLAYNRRRGHS